MTLPDEESLPPYLQITDPLDPDQTALQVMLLTGELRMQRQTLTALAGLLDQMAAALRLPTGLTDDEKFGGSI